MTTREYLLEKCLSNRWQISPRSLQRWRLEGKGPSYTKICGNVRYALDVIETYEAMHTHLTKGHLMLPEELLNSNKKAL